MRRLSIFFTRKNCPNTIFGGHRFKYDATNTGEKVTGITESKHNPLSSEAPAGMESMTEAEHIQLYSYYADQMLKALDRFFDGEGIEGVSISEIGFAHYK